MAVFDGVRYSLSPSLSPTRRNELASVLDLNGAVQHAPYTHLILFSASHAHHDATNDPTVKLVTDRWVDRSIVLGKCQPEQYYSPDPAMIFSGVVACATDLSAPDLEVLSAGITALGGQWRTGLTRDVTHLFALRPGSDKYNTAVHYAPQTHMCIVTPHWFDDAVRLGRRIPETPYTWPDPQILRPGMSLDGNGDALATEGKRKRKAATETEGGDGTDIPNEGEQVRVWDGRRILLSTTLELAESSRGAIEAGVRRAGGVVVSIAEDANEDAEENAVDECDVLITRWRSGKSYFKAVRAALLIGTLSWLFNVESSGTLHSPLDSLLWYPTPRGGIPGLVNCEISVTNYTGAARDYLKRLIGLIGAKFTPSMSQSNKVLVAGFQPSPKTTRALSWSIPVVNHTWLEDCFVEWQALTVGLERYIVYPPGIDFGKMLMTRRDEPASSQTVSVPRLNGGAVPGGRGVGIIDLEREEIRDAQYRVRPHKDGGPFGVSTTRKNDTTMDDVRPPSRAGSVKKTPSSSVRAKRRSMSTSTAMGAFIDHVIEIPADDDKGEGGGRRTPGSGKQNAQMPVLGPRASATPRSASRASSAGLFSNGEVEVVVRHLPGSSKGGKEKDKGKEKSEGKGDVGKRQAGTAKETGADKNKDTPQPVGPPKLKPQLVRRRLHIESGDETEERAPAQTSKPRRWAAKGRTIDSDLESGGEISEASMPPRRPTDSTTPVKSGMKPRPKSMSTPKPRSVPSEESDDEVIMISEDSAPAMGSEGPQNQMVKSTRNGEIVTKKQEKERVKGKEKASEGRKVTPHPRSPTRSPAPTSPETKNPRAPKRRLSVLVPSVPKDYFSSQGERDREREGEKRGTDASASTSASVTSEADRKLLTPARSLLAVSAEASTSTGKRGKPKPVKPSTGHALSRGPGPEPRPKPMPKPKSAMSKAHTRDDDEDMDKRGEDDDSSMIIDLPAISSRSGPRRSAANKATTRLREEVMPDVISFEKERKNAKRRRSEDWESVASVRGGGVREKEERVGKKRKVPREEEAEVVEEAEVEEVVIPPVKTKPKLMNGKFKTKVATTTGSDEEMDDVPAKNKLSGSVGKKVGRPRAKELATIRVMTTGVTLTDDVVKRLTKLGVQMTTKPTDCTHLIAKSIMRTEKFLCAMSVSPYVLTEEWANTSAKGGKLLPEKDYLLSDAAAEQKWGFKFADALARAKHPQGGPNLFKQMMFYVTPKIGVDIKLFKNVVSAGGGQVQTATLPTVRILKGKADRYVVSCQEDKGIWRPLVEEGFKVYSPELVLRGALRQEIEWEREECLVAG